MQDVQGPNESNNREIDELVAVEWAQTKAQLNIARSNYFVGRTMDKKPVVIILFVMAFLVALHQFYYWKTWFNVGDIHHETLVVALICLALGILLSEKLGGARP